LQEVGKHQHHPYAAKAESYLAFNVVAGYWELVQAVKLHQRRKHRYQQQQQQHDTVVIA
jgi:hypothetical protein